MEIISHWAMTSKTSIRSKRLRNNLPVLKNRFMQLVRTVGEQRFFCGFFAKYSVNSFSYVNDYQFSTIKGK
jgi:hypothetical protein